MSSTKVAESNGSEAVPDIRQLEIPRPALKQATVHIQGVSPLIQHRWSVKALRALEATQTGKAKAPRAPKKPEEEALSAAYIVPGHENDDNEPGKFYMPAPAFKHAFLYGVSQLDDQKKFPKTRATAWVFINSDPILNFERVTMRTDVGRNPTQVVYRLQFDGWSTDLDITFNANAITPEQIVAIFEGGGVGGVGEWRPTSPKNKSGDFGRFRVTGISTEE